MSKKLIVVCLICIMTSAFTGCNVSTNDEVQEFQEDTNNAMQNLKHNLDVLGNMAGEK